jgi:hypothetical protein
VPISSMFLVSTSARNAQEFACTAFLEARVLESRAFPSLRRKRSWIDSGNFYLLSTALVRDGVGASIASSLSISVGVTEMGR